MIRSLVYLILIATTLISPFFGAVDLDIESIFKFDSLQSSIFFDLRVPRVLFAIFCGAILALSGLLFQTLFRNALMTPYTLGVSSGAVLGAGIAIKLGLGSLIFGVAAVSLFGFFGALVTIFLLLFILRYLKNSHYESILLIGIALSLFYTSALMIVFYLGNTMQNDMLLRFTMGSLSVIGWDYPIVIGIVAIFLFLCIYTYRYELELLSLSDESAKIRGVDTKRVTFILLVVSSISIGVVVSISGPIGFIGLIVPHIVSKLHPVSIKNRILKTALFGGLFLLLCDTISRVINTQSELPIGIVTALIGGVFFIYLIISKSKKS
jgi:iron complex transport system permease protein